MSSVSSCLRNRSVQDKLRRQLSRPLEERSPAEVWSTGLPFLDALLPDQGLRSGSLVEWLGASGSGAGTLAWLVLRSLQEARSIMVIDADREFFPPGVHHLGIDLRRVLIVRPSGPADTLWAMEQSLRSRAGCFVLGRIEAVPHQAYRRLKLAAERGGGIGMFLRPLSYRRDPSWADVRLLVQSHSIAGGDSSGPAAPHFRAAQHQGMVFQGSELTRKIRLQLLRARGGGFQQRQTMISINDDARVMSVDSELARSTSSGSTARAS